MPLIRKVKGKETIASIGQKIETKTFERLQEKISNLGFTTFPEEIAIYAFKEERLLEVYVKKDNILQKLISYKFTNFSGELGPKLKEGDKQIPEGIYKIEHLNPNSAYYLSMKVNYPNAFDIKKGKIDGRTDLGTNIFIHGKDVTIGCIPIGDDAIEELFILCKYALKNEIEVVIAPRDFRVNPQEPTINSVNWSGELYSKIKKNLNDNF